MAIFSSKSRFATRMALRRIMPPGAVLLACVSLTTGLTARAQQAPQADWAPQVLLRFADAPNGVQPSSAQQPPVYNAADGKLYGVTPGSSAGGSGFYQFDPASPETFSALGFTTQEMLSKFYTGTGGYALDAQGVLHGLASGLAIAKLGGKVYRWSGSASQQPEAVAPAGTPDREYLTGQPVFDAQGNLYFTAVVPGLSSGEYHPYLYRISATDGSLASLVQFSRDGYIEMVGNVRNYTKGYYTVSLLHSQDDGGTLYGLADNWGSFGASGTPDTDPTGVLYRVSLDGVQEDGSSPVEVLHTFTKGEVERLRDSADGDGYRYAITESGDFIYGNSNISIWRVRKSTGEFRMLHRIGSGEDDVAAQDDGVAPKGVLTVAADGNVYGTTLKAGADAQGNARHGALYRIVVDQDSEDRAGDKYEVLSYFDLVSTGGSPTGLSLGPVVAEEQAQLLYGTTTRGGKEGDTASGQSNGTLFAVRVPVAEGSVTLESSSDTVTVGESATLSWQALNVAAGACVASGGQQDDGWETDAVQAASGSVSVTPAAAGSVQYSLTCTDRLGVERSASVDVQVDAAPDSTDPGDGQGGDGDQGGGETSNPMGSSGGGGAATPLMLLAALLMVLSKAVLARVRSVRVSRSAAR